MTGLFDPQAVPDEHGPRTSETIVFLHGGNMAGWTWLPQVERLPDRHLLTPDMPGFGGRSSEQWPGTVGAADDIADIIAERANGGRAHVVGLSLGGLVAAHVVQRHPDRVLSCTISGAALCGYSRRERLLIRAQVPLWNKRWYWAAQVIPFGIPKDSRQAFVDTTTRPSKRTNWSVFEEIVAGTMPPGDFTYQGPMLAVSAEKDTPSVSQAFAPLRQRVPQLQTWTAPGMHHPWNVEDPELFTQMVVTFADTGVWPGLSQ